MSRLRISAGLILTLLSISSTFAGDVRTWTSGKYTLEAEFVELMEDGATVLLQTSDERRTIELSKLSQADQDWIAERLADDNPFKRVPDQADKNPFEVVPEAPEPGADPASETVADDWSDSATRPAGTRNTIEIEGNSHVFCWAPAGEFTMGSPESEEGREDDEA